MDKKCTGECIRCSFQQQVYCSAQYGRAIMTYMPAIIERLDKIVGQEIFNPLEEAQKGSGAENRESKNT